MDHSNTNRDRIDRVAEILVSETVNHLSHFFYMKFILSIVSFYVDAETNEAFSRNTTKYSAISPKCTSERKGSSSQATLISSQIWAKWELQKNLAIDDCDQNVKGKHMISKIPKID